MALYIEQPDFLWSADGDLVLDTDGDMAGTENYLYRATVQRIITRLTSARGEWILQPTIGGDLQIFYGKPNTRVIGQQLKDRVINTLAEDGLLSRNQYRVDIVPIGEHEILVLLALYLSGTNKKIILSLTYNLALNQLVVHNA